MALFARRQVQAAIDQCGTFMPAEAIAPKVAELNASNDNSLPTEWEIMLTAAASRVCPLEYEPDLGGASKADLLMMPSGRGTSGCLVEITTISDEHAHQQNPRDTVCTAIQKRLKKLRAPVAGWHIQVDGKRIGKYGDAEMRLLLGNGRPDELFDQQFYDFVRAVKANPSERRVHEWRGDLLQITLTFDPNQRGISGGNLVYTVVHSLKRNPLARRLVEKTKQLRRSGHPGPYGLVVCDGDCNVLSTRSTAGSSFSTRDILWDHFRIKRHLSFVLVLYIETRVPSFLERERIDHVLHATPYVREDAPPVAVEALRRLAAAITSLPQPLASPANAVRCYLREEEHEWWQFPGGSITMSDNRIMLSSRALLEMLAGRKTPQEFFACFPDKWFKPGNFFDGQRIEGRCITDVKFVKGKADDDEIEFTFGPPDAAAAKYRVPVPKDGKPAPE